MKFGASISTTTRASVNGNRRTTPYRMEVEDCIIQDLFDELIATSDYVRRREEIGVLNAKSKIVKRGIAITPVKFGISFTKSFLNQAGALIHVYNDGSIGLNHGGTEMGQGLFTKVAQVVAEEFQVDASRIKITATTTAKVPNTSATAASSGSDLNGMAAANAARKIKARLVAFLAEHYQAAPQDIQFKPGRIKVANTELSFDDAVMQAYMARIPLSATGFYATPKISWDKTEATGRPFFYFAYGAAVAEAAIDTLTGENRLLRVDILHDVGKSPEPGTGSRPDRGRLRPGCRLAHDGGTGLERPGPVDDPRAFDLQDSNLLGSGHLTCASASMTTGRTPRKRFTGPRAVGEPPLMLGIAAFLAISDAIASVGEARCYPALDAPATPERVLFAVERMRQNATGGTAS